MIADDPTVAHSDQAEPAVESLLTPGIGLCLSGGGYRAMLYHIGALWRLNELGLLTRISRFSSVSGGSITAAWLACTWVKRGWNCGVVPRDDFEGNFATPLLELAGRTIDIPCVLQGLLPWCNVGREVAARYDRYLFNGMTLQDLPVAPRFVINASNLQSGAVWRFSRPYMGDWKVGLVRRPRLSLASAVAASSAFPPILSPFELKLKHGDFSSSGRETLQKPPFTTRPVLSDGGVYDNLGLETVFKHFETVLVSDGGAPFREKEHPARFWPFQLKRVLDCIDNQVRSLRTRQVMLAFKEKSRRGAHWGIGTPIVGYGRMAGLVLPCPLSVTRRLARVSTRLGAMPRHVRLELVNWGYASCAASLEANYPHPGPAPAWPFPQAALD